MMDVPVAPGFLEPAGTKPGPPASNQRRDDDADSAAYHSKGTGIIQRRHTVSDKVDTDADKCELAHGQFLSKMVLRFFGFSGGSASFAGRP